MTRANRWPVLSPTVVGSAVTLTGLAFLATVLARPLRETWGPLLFLLGVALPALLSAVTAAAGYVIARTTLRDDHATRIAAFWLAGIGLGAVMGVATVLYEQGHGTVLAGGPYIVVNNAVGGGLGGLLVGTYNVGVRRRADRLRERTEQLETERERARSRGEQLEMLNRLVTHDIRNDLNVIRGRTDMATDHVDDAGREHLATVRRSTTDAIDLTRMAGDFASSLDGRTAEDLHPVDLGSTLRAQLQRLRETHPDVDVAADLDGAPRVLTDDLLSSVFRNLLVNAATHGDGTVSVSVDADERDAVVVRVSDDGPGIPDARRERIFGRGERGRESDGTGIGLYLADRLVIRYGGEVRVEDDRDDTDATAGTAAGIAPDAAADGTATGATFAVRLRTA